MLGGNLAQAGFAVMTGGYFGVMEAVSKGAFEASGHTIGVTVANWESRGFRSKPNPYLSTIEPRPSLTERLLYLVSECDAAVALEGGVGTVSEVSLLWSFIQTNEVKQKPLILVGEWWGQWFAMTRRDGQFITQQTLDLVTWAETPAEAVEVLKEYFA